MRLITYPFPANNLFIWEIYMRIVTRPDFDGIVCAVLLYNVENIDKPIFWVEPGDIQNAIIEIQPGDIMANLPYDDRCSLWFDHHVSNKTDKPFQGAYDIAPSAARVVYDFYKDKIKTDYTELIDETDKIDAAQLSMDEVRHPEDHPYVLLSMTISNRNKTDEPYWNKLTGLLGKKNIQDILKDPDVREKCKMVIDQNIEYKKILTQHTEINKHISITDLRPFETAPVGNRFLVYSLFPDTVVSVKIRYADDDREKIILSVGHNIFNQHCHVHVGPMLSKYNGGGHRGAGACSFHISKADQYIPEIIETLLKNESPLTP